MILFWVTVVCIAAALMIAAMSDVSAKRRREIAAELRTLASDERRLAALRPDSAHYYRGCASGLEYAARLIEK